MASAINSDNGVVSGSAGLKSSADSSGVLDLQTNGTTAISISASQVVTYTNQPTYTGGTANGVMYLNGSKAVTTGTALTFDGTLLRSSTYLGLSTNTTPDTSTGDAIFYKASAGATLSGFNLVYETGSAGSRSEKMRLDNSGNLLLGTTSGSARLTVDSGSSGLMASFNSTNASGGYIPFNTSGTVYGDIGTAGQVVSGGSASDFGINARGARNLVFGSNNVERARITAGGVLDIASGAGAVGQIQFPATQVASSNANTLDDYEEGTFTPTFSGAGSPTYESVNAGWYIKIGKMVQFTLLVSAGNISANSNQVTVAGLPFTVSNISSNHYPCPSVFVENGINATDSTSGYAMLMNPGDTVIRLWAIFPSTGVNYNDVLYNEVNNGAGLSNVRLRITGTYMAIA